MYKLIPTSCFFRVWVPARDQVWNRASLWSQDKDLLVCFCFVFQWLIDCTAKTRWFRVFWGNIITNWMFRFSDVQAVFCPHVAQRCHWQSSFPCRWRSARGGLSHSGSPVGVRFFTHTSPSRLAESGSHWVTFLRFHSVVWEQLYPAGHAKNLFLSTEKSHGFSIFSLKGLNSRYHLCLRFLFFFFLIKRAHF